MHKYHPKFKRFIQNCQKNNIVPSFEDYLKENQKDALSFIESGDEDEFLSYYRMFVRSANELGVTVAKRS
ncbi:hypothetical protein BD560DRAFT_163982 [Blakeslea trispora]|nr:hypothetical protein BD560DRAFT_163982 [Blakeslea trispora]